MRLKDDYPLYNNAAYVLEEAGAVNALFVQIMEKIREKGLGDGAAADADFLYATADMAVDNCKTALRSLKARCRLLLQRVDEEGKPK